MTRDEMIVLHRTERRFLPLMVVSGLLISTAATLTGCPHGDSQSPPQPSAQTQASPVVSGSAPVPQAAALSVTVPGPPPGVATGQQLQELLSPIALYPDLLVAQILAAATYPTQIVEAHRWLRENPNLNGEQLAAGVNVQPWDPGIKSLTQFASVLQTMNDNLAWTSALGEAYFNQPAEVMKAIQVLRKMAMDAGSLKTTPQQKVEVQSTLGETPAPGGQVAPQQTIIIQPVAPTVVYVPQYNPQTVYGSPLAPGPGYVATPVPGYTGRTEMLTTGLVSFGLGMLLAMAINDNNNDWDCDWHGGSVNYNHNVYVSRTNVIRTGYRPIAYPQRPYAGLHPRPAPYEGARPRYNAGGPYTRPYDPVRAKAYAANSPNLTKPNFPSTNTLPTNPPGPNKGEGIAPQNKPIKQPSNGRTSVTARTGKRKATIKLPRNLGSDPLRGYVKDRGSAGGRNGALGGYEPGGFIQKASARGEASFAGTNNRSSGSGKKLGRANKGRGRTKRD